MNDLWIDIGYNSKIYLYLEYNIENGNLFTPHKS
jgi:hypothetical protein